MAVTQILFDPRVDLPTGGTAPLTVTIKATPLALRVEGASTVYPSNLTFTGITAATPFGLNSTDGTWAWSIGVYDTAAQRARVLQHRVVAVTGTTKTWADLTDIDPDTFTEGTPGPAWFAAIAALPETYVTYDGANFRKNGAVIPATGTSGMQYLQPSPAAQWSIQHSLGRRPSVALYDAAGSLILADVVATASLVLVTYANPTAGSAVLT